MERDFRLPDAPRNMPASSHSLMRIIRHDVAEYNDNNAVEFKKRGELPASGTSRRPSTLPYLPNYPHEIPLYICRATAGPGVPFLTRMVRVVEYNDNNAVEFKRDLPASGKSTYRTVTPTRLTLHQR